MEDRNGEGGIGLLGQWQPERTVDVKRFGPAESGRFLPTCNSVRGACSQWPYDSSSAPSSCLIALSVHRAGRSPQRCLYIRRGTQPNLSRGPLTMLEVFLRTVEVSRIFRSSLCRWLAVLGLREGTRQIRGDVSKDGNGAPKEIPRETSAEEPDTGTYLSVCAVPYVDTYKYIYTVLYTFIGRVQRRKFGSP